MTLQKKLYSGLQTAISSIISLCFLIFLAIWPAYKATWACTGNANKTLRNCSLPSPIKINTRFSFDLQIYINDLFRAFIR